MSELKNKIDQINKKTINDTLDPNIKIVLRKSTWKSIMRRLDDGDEISKKMALLIFLDYREQIK